MTSSSVALAIAWMAGMVVLLVAVGIALRVRKRGGSMTAGVAGAVWDLQTDQKRKAIEVVVEKRAAARDAEDADGNLPELDRPLLTDEFSLLEFRGWQRVAGRYQDTWGGLTERFVPALLESADVGTGRRVLDVACGPGFVADAAHARGAEVVAIDFSPEVVTIARARCPELDVRRGDAQALEFGDGAFDIVLMNFGLLHLADPSRAFHEAARVLRPGGTYAFTVWAETELSPGAKIVQDAVKAHGTVDVHVPQGPDHLRHGRLEDWRQTLHGAGFDPASVVVEAVRAEWEVPTDFFLFEAERHAGVRTAALLAAQTPEALNAIDVHTTRAVREFAKDGAYAIPFAAYVVRAMTPLA
jgi:SAM-dependent methyltransferase